MRVNEGFCGRLMWSKKVERQTERKLKDIRKLNQKKNATEMNSITIAKRKNDLKLE